MPRTVAPSSPPPPPQTVSARVRGAITSRAGNGAERTWRISDFPDMSPQAVAQALSRLAREGEIVRLSKGVYAVKGSAAGRVRVYDARRMTGSRCEVAHPVFPAGLLAFNALQLSRQNTPRPVMSTTGTRAPRECEEAGIRVITRRPAAWRALEAEDAAILEVLRDGAVDSEYEPRDTAQVLVHHVLRKGRLARLLPAVRTEPARVRAMLGALLENSRRARSVVGRATLDELRASLNPLSRYDFGQLGLLPTAKRWYAKAPLPLW